MKLTDKQFWIWEIATTFFLSAFPLMLYGENISVIILIVLSHAIANATCLLVSSPINIGLMWFLIFLGSVGAYIIYVALIIVFKLIIMEPYPLAMGQVYFLPIYILVSGTMCALGGLIMRNCRKGSQISKT